MNTESAPRSFFLTCRALFSLTGLLWFGGLAATASGQTITNPSFETDASTGAATGPITGWAFTAGSGGINDSAGPVADNGAIPAGAKVAFMQGAGTMRQTVSGFVVGQPYRLRYYENAATHSAPTTANLQVTVGGVSVVPTHEVLAVGGTLPYVHQTSEAFTATATSLEIAFVASGSGDFKVLLDDIIVGQNFVVTTVEDSGLGSLRQAVLDAPAGSVITFDVAVPATISLVSQITVNNSLSIVGPGETQLTLRNVAPQSPTSRLFDVTSGPVAISGLTLKDGNIPGVLYIPESGGAGILSEASGLTLTDVTILNCLAGDTGNIDLNSKIAIGGAILGNATLNHCTFANNFAKYGGAFYGSGAINNSFIHDNGGYESGGGVYFFGTISNSTISNNNAGGTYGGGGGGIYVSDLTTVSNSTISGNSSTLGGGIFGEDGGLLTLINSTVSNNLAGGRGTGIHVETLYASSLPGKFTSRNSIISGNIVLSQTGANTVGGDIFGVVISQGNNVLGGSPSLAPLGFHGGAFYTHAPLSNSPAINAASIATSPVGDQRGAARVGTADIGCFELNNSANGGGFIARLPDSTGGTAYSFTLVPDLVQNYRVFTYTVTSGALPPGISRVTRLPYDATRTAVASGVVTLEGTSTRSGTFNFPLLLRTDRSRL